MLSCYGDHHGRLILALADAEQTAEHVVRAFVGSWCAPTRCLSTSRLIPLERFPIDRPFLTTQ